MNAHRNMVLLLVFVWLQAIINLKYVSLVILRLVSPLRREIGEIPIWNCLWDKVSFRLTIYWINGDIKSSVLQLVYS